MRQIRHSLAWVVYRKMAKTGKTFTEVNVVCEQGEWEVIERAEPGVHVLVHNGIGTEEEAEKLARGTSGDPRPRK